MLLVARSAGPQIVEPSSGLQKGVGGTAKRGRVKRTRWYALKNLHAADEVASVGLIEQPGVK